MNAFSLLELDEKSYLLGRLILTIHAFPVTPYPFIFHILQRNPDFRLNKTIESLLKVAI